MLTTWNNIPVEYQPGYHVLINRTMRDTRGCEIRILFAWYHENIVHGDEYRALVYWSHGEYEIMPYDILCLMSGWQWAD